MQILRNLRGIVTFSASSSSAVDTQAFRVDKDTDGSPQDVHEPLRFRDPGRYQKLWTASDLFYRAGDFAGADGRLPVRGEAH